MGEFLFICKAKRETFFLMRSAKNPGN